MIRIDYNKIMYFIAIIFIILFAIFTTVDYINYTINNNSAPFYVFLIIRSVEFILPSLVLYYLYNQNTLLKETHYIIKNTKILDGFNGYKIAHISDFHNTNSQRVKLSLIKSLERNSPDVIVVTGDLIDSRRTNIETAVEFLQSMKHIAPIYYVLGNHEARIEDVLELERNAKRIGVTILRNKVITIQKQNNEIKVIGLDDPAFYITSEEQQSYEQIKDKVQLRLEEIIEENDKFKILLTHRPELITTYAKYKLDLIFTGHAHGGQIRIPFIGGIIAPGQGFFPKYTSGVYEIDNTKMVLSRGIGNSKFPFRINNRPELIFVTLKRDI